jgi:hypothetical protein
MSSTSRSIDAHPARSSASATVSELERLFAKSARLRLARPLRERALPRYNALSPSPPPQLAMGRVRRRIEGGRRFCVGSGCQSRQEERGKEREGNVIFSPADGNCFDFLKPLNPALADGVIIEAKRLLHF